MVNFWILPTTMEHWEQVSAQDVYAFQNGLDRNEIEIDCNAGSFDDMLPTGNRVKAQLLCKNA